MKTDYELLTAQLTSVCEGVEDEISNLANASALLYHGLDGLNWAGFYLLKGGSLRLGPFQGRAACTVIPMGKGVCGTAAQKGETIVVADVHQFAGHIACDSASNSEIVIPLRKSGEIYGVLDIDSPLPGRFSREDQAGLEQFAAVLEQILR